MDIVKNSRTVKTVLERNGLIEPEHDSEEGMLHRERKTAGVNSNYLWPKGRIPYVFESSVSEFSRMIVVFFSTNTASIVSAAFPRERPSEHFSMTYFG